MTAHILNFEAFVAQFLIDTPDLGPGTLPDHEDVRQLDSLVLLEIAVVLEELGVAPEQIDLTRPISLRELYNLYLEAAVDPTV